MKDSAITITDQFCGAGGSSIGAEKVLRQKGGKVAVAFDHDYVVLGSGKDKVKQLGNAVTPPAMEWLVSRCVESLEK